MTGTAWAATGGRIFDGDGFHEGSALLIDGSRFAGIVAEAAIPRGYDRVEFEGGTLAPGFVDLQVNGGGGVMLNDDPSVETLRTIAEAHATLGTTSLLPTLITDTPTLTSAAIEAADSAVRQGVPGIAGLHLEGPHLSVARKGAHDPALIRPMTDEDVDLLLDAARRLPVLFITVAPENVTPGQIRLLAGAGIVLSLGHSDCAFDTAREAVDNGAHCVTHLFNAMSQIGSREPGLAGAALRLPDLSAGLIADLVHVHPETIRLALSAKFGPGRMFLVTDAMAPAGTDLAEFTLNGRTIRREAGRLTLANGTLAGADLDLLTAVRNIRALGVPEAEALAMATSAPASVIRASDRMGGICAGQTADFLHIDAGTRVAGVWRGGERIAGR